MTKRGSSGLSLLLAIDKPKGMTSHDVVNRVRQITGERRVGHAGTLDPAATGLMLVGVGLIMLFSASFPSAYYETVSYTHLTLPTNSRV